MNALWQRRWATFGAELGRVVLLTLLLGYTMLPLRVSAPNERSRLYLTYALVEQQSFQIDAPRQLFGGIYDEAIYQGHYYTDKAPGSSLIAVPAYALYRAFVPAKEVTIDAIVLLGRYGVMLPVSLIGFFALKALAQSLGLGRRLTELVAWSSLVATTALHYAASFYGHHLVAVLWILALLLLVKTQLCKGPRAHLGHFTFGVLLGFAQLTEYQAILGTLTFCALWLWTFRTRWQSGLAALLLGALPFAAFLLHYQSSCFGGPFEVSYHHLTNPALASVHGKGVGGVLLPNLERLSATLFSLHRGLFSTAPFLVLFPLGIWGLMRRGNGAWALTLCVLVTAYIGFMASSLTWEAGWGYGPRLLLPVVPLLVLLVGLAAQHFGRFARFWALFASAWLASLLGVQAVTAFFPEPPNELKNPLIDVVWVLIREGVFPSHLGSAALGLTGPWSLLPLALLLLWPCRIFYRTAAASVPPRRWLWALPLVPLLLLGATRHVRNSTSTRDQVAFAEFVKSLEKP